jgi:hypothetical protein
MMATHKFVKEDKNAIPATSCVLDGRIVLIVINPKDVVTVVSGASYERSVSLS